MQGGAATEPGSGDTDSEPSEAWFVIKYRFLSMHYAVLWEFRICGKAACDPDLLHFSMVRERAQKHVTKKKWTYTVPELSDAWIWLVRRCRLMFSNCSCQSNGRSIIIMCFFFLYGIVSMVTTHSLGVNLSRIIQH